MISPERRRLLSLLVVCAVGGAVAYFALRSSPYLQYIPWMPRGVGIWADKNGIFRNVVAFFVLAAGVFLVIGRRVWHVVLLCSFATGLEACQLWIPGRVFDRLDIVASIAGVLLAWPVVWVVRRAAVK